MNVVTFRDGSLLTQPNPQFEIHTFTTDPGFGFAG